VTTLAPLPGRNGEPGDAGDAHAGEPSAPSGPSAPSAPSATVDLTGRKANARPSDIAGQATWLFGLALALLTEGTAEELAMAEVLAEAAGRPRALEGAYGRAVALLSEFPGDPLVHRTVDLMAKALLRSRRPARAAEEA
jgi:hypothetical protein